MQFLSDYPDNHGGNIVGLARKSIRWHDHERGRLIVEALSTMGPERRAFLPPIALPAHPHIRFLATVKDICEEGTAMEHCIATYADKAIQGECFLFHVEHMGTSASVEVSWRGKVLQSCGPRNQENVATQWGRRVLGRWGKDLRQSSQQRPPMVAAELDTEQQVAFDLGEDPF